MLYLNLLIATFSNHYLYGSRQRNIWGADWSPSRPLQVLSLQSQAWR
ncbi:MAG: hypothetical protein RMY28_037890 [Nostoc sp. ChiSLP01]|nr:hypothetical protein [Nostoc sp. CmiSLP01]MDZ8284581.1 hypothetical protein [Nostoc sp. ChiSLP01]